MSATPQQAWTALIDQLNDALDTGGAISYVKGVYEGVRDTITKFPVVIVEPLREPEETGGLSGQTDVRMEVQITGIVKVEAKTKQIVGEGNVKGIMDLKNDLAKAISSDHTLGGVVTDTNIKDVRYEWRDYPYRAFTMDIEIQYRQNTKTRA